MPKTPSLDDRIDLLYAGPSEDFIARRDELVKELKAAKDKDGAAAVKALRKPTAAAWAVNQLAHSSRRDVAKLLDVGETLREAHEALSDGKGDAAIRSATTKRRKLVGDLTDRAVALLGAGGEAQRDAISNTLDAAVADPDAGISVQEGRLTKELAAPSGFGAGLVFATPPAPPRESASRREERRAARAAARTGGDTPEAPAKPTRRGASAPADTDTAPDADAPRSKAAAPSAAERKKAEAERKQRFTAAQQESERRTAEAQQAARDASAARQEVSRLQDLLVTANAKSKAADEKARLTQWAAATAQQALRDAERQRSDAEA